jgi:alkylhydroperoxidase/carboxymuconolactone decarboxylase family protein YurZ
MPAQPSSAQQTFADFAPKLAELTEDVLFGDIWERPGTPASERATGPTKIGLVLRFCCGRWRI